ncbi:hypothetical protein AB9E26_35440, partial [Rhizobium leguminosarum]
DLLLSESSRDRLRGAQYLAELGQDVEGLNVAATQLADDALSDCRRAFVEYKTVFFRKVFLDLLDFLAVADATNDI